MDKQMKPPRAQRLGVSFFQKEKSRQEAGRLRFLAHSSPRTEARGILRCEIKASEQMVILVDENDNFLGKYLPRHKAHTGQGIRHRAFVCFLLNKAKEILLQKRKHWLWDNLWDVTAISHPLHLEDHDESYEEATLRALKKEMGLRSVAIKKLGGFNYFKKHEKDNGCENEYCAIMYGRYNGKVSPNPEDIYEYKWMNFEEFINDTKTNPAIYTPWSVLTVQTLEKDGPLYAFLKRKLS